MTPGKFSEEIIQTRKLIDDRITKLQTMLSMLKLGTSNHDIILNETSKTLAKISGITNRSNAELLEAAIKNIEQVGMQPIPIEELEGLNTVDAMHRKFKYTTAAVLNSEHVPEFLAAVLKKGTDEVRSNTVNISNEIDVVRAFTTKHADDIKEYLSSVAANPEKDLIESFKFKGDEIRAQLQNTQRDTLKLFNNIKQTQDISVPISESIINKLDSIIGKLSFNGPVPTYPHLAQYINKLENIEYGLNDIKNYGENLQNFKSNFSKLDAEGMLRETFDNIFNGLAVCNSNLKAAITATKSGDAGTLLNAMNNMTSKLAYARSMVDVLKVKNFKNFMPVGGNLEVEFENLKSTVTGLVSNFPNQAMNTYSNDVKTLINITKDLGRDVKLTNRGSRPLPREIDTIKNRIESSASEVKSHLSSIITAVSGFNPVVSNIARTALGALKSVASASMEELSRGNVLSFQRTFDNPMLLTKIGRCQIAISEAMRNPKLSVEELSTMQTLLDFVNNEQAKEVMSNFISDLDLQKSLAIQGVDKYVKNVLTPTQRLLDKYKALKQRREGGDA